MSDFPFGIAFGPNEKTDSSGDLHEIKKLQQRIAELEALRDTSIAAARIKKLEAQVESLQNKCATRGLSPEDSDALQADNFRLRAALQEIKTKPGNARDCRRIAAEALKGEDDE